MVDHASLINPIKNKTNIVATLTKQRMGVVNAWEIQLPLRAATLMSAQVILEYIK